MLEDRTRTAMATQSFHRIHVYRRRRWPARFFVVLYALDGPLVVATIPSVDKARVAVVFGSALVLSLVWLYASERRAIHVQEDGIRVVPYFGDARRYPWSRIADFSVRTWSRDEVRWGRILDTTLSVLWALNYRGGPLSYPRDRGGPTVMMDLTDVATAAPLSLTRRSPRKRDAVQRVCDQLNAERRRHPASSAQSGARDTSTDPVS